MARSVTLAQLRTRVLRAADLEDLNYISSTEVNDYISTAYGELYDLLVNKGLNHFESTQSITTTGVEDYNLPSDYYGTVGVDLIDGGKRYPLQRYESAERNFYQNATSSYALGYRIVGTKIRLSPATSGGTYQHIYIPAPAVLDDDADTVDGVAGWEELIVIDAAIKCRRKEDESVSELKEEREHLMARIKRASENRYQATPIKLGGRTRRLTWMRDFAPEDDD